MNGLISALTSRLENSGERLIITMMGFLAAMLLMVVAIVAVVYAGATAVSEVYGPVIAALTVAVGALVAAIMVLVWLSHRRKVVARQALLRQSSAQSPALAAASVVLPTMLKASPMGTLIAIAAAAYVISKASQRDG